MQAREGLHLMEWKRQEAGPSVPTPLIRDKRTMVHPANSHAHKKTAELRATLVPDCSRLETQALLEISDSGSQGRNTNGATLPHQKPAIIMNDANDKAQKECPKTLSQWDIDVPLFQKTHARMFRREWAR